MKLKPLSLLLALSVASPALAIGLGELSVRSHLGQPLHVTVEVLDPPATLDTGCLSLHPAPNGLTLPARARLTLERSGARTLVHINTRENFVEPAAQFVLTSDCDGRLQREYVLLLDPPPLPAAAAIPDAVATQPTTEPSATSAAQPPASKPNVARAAQAPASKPVTAAKRAAPKPRAQSTQQQAQPRPTPQLAPRLVISGGSMPAAGSEGESSAGGHTLTIAELSDENTALLRKLVHIESQLVELNRRNAELETRLNAVMPAAPAATSAPTSRWLLYSVGLLGLIAGSGALFAWQRRRERSLDTSLEALTWNLPGPAPATSGRVVPASTRTAAPGGRLEEADEFPLTAGSAGTEVKEDAVDQAEVLAVHGYAGLAIQLLREHLRVAPSESPTPWLLLLDLLHREHDDKGYAEASAQLRRHFNVNFPERPAETPVDDSLGLLAYPHILDMLTQAWNTPALEGIFQNLIYDKRGGLRVGFDPVAYQDILLLRDIADTVASPGR